MRNRTTSGRNAGLLLLLLTLVLFLKIPELYQVWNYNRANLYLLRWSILGDWDCEKEYLARAIQWGERAGVYWENSYRDHASAILSQVCAHSAPTIQDLANTSFNAGREYEAQGQLKRALTSYQDACDKYEKHVMACFSAYRLLADNSEPDLGDSYLRSLLELVPDYEIETNQDGEMQLVGYDIQLMEFEEESVPIPVMLYWDVSISTGMISQWEENGWSYIQIGSRLYQNGEIQNLLPNGGFERDISTNAVLPFGYQNVRYSANQDIRILSNHHRLDMVEREQEISQAAVVVNPEEELNGLTTKNGVDISPGELYLLSGLMRVSESGQGSLGGIWRSEKLDDIHYWYIARNSMDPSWTRLNGVFKSPENAEIFTLLALNTGEGEVYFDNLLFFHIPHPGKGSGSIDG